MHCLSSSGRRDPRELTTAECKAVIDELERMQVFYVNIGGGEPTVRRDFWELVDYAVAHHVGVKFSTNGSRITRGARRAPGRATDYVDVQISLDGATAEVNDAVRGPGLATTRRSRAMEQPAPTPASGLQDVGRRHPRRTSRQLDEFKALADRYGAQLRLTRLRPSGRGADVWDELHPTAAQQRELYDWLLAHGEDVLTGDSFFHLGGLGEALPGLNLCGAGRVVCLIDPIGDVYACPFAIHDEFLAGNVRAPRRVRRGLARLRAVRGAARSRRPPARASSCGCFDTCRGGCMAAKFFTGLPLDGPDPECVLGHGERLLAARGDAAACRSQAWTTRDAAGQPQAPAAPASQRLRREPAGETRRRTADEAWSRNRVVRVGRGRAAPRAEAAPAESVYSALIAGSERGLTLADNIAAFSELGFAPHVGGAPAQRDMTHDRDGAGDLAAGDHLARPACRRCTPTARWRSPGPRPRAAPRWG